MSFDVALEVGNAPVLLNIVTSDNRTPGAKFPFGERGAILTLEVTGGGMTSVGVRAPGGTGGTGTLFRLGRSGTRRREGCTTERGRLVGGLALVQSWRRGEFVLIVGGGKVVGISVRL